MVVDNSPGAAAFAKDQCKTTFFNRIRQRYIPASKYVCWSVRKKVDIDIWKGECASVRARVFAPVHRIEFFPPSQQFIPRMKGEFIATQVIFHISVHIAVVPCLRLAVYDSQNLVLKIAFVESRFPAGSNQKQEHQNQSFHFVPFVNKRVTSRFILPACCFLCKQYILRWNFF